MRLLHPTRRTIALLTALVGAMNIVSALYPAIPGRLELLQDLLPLYSIRASQTATALAGCSLILLADGLRKRRQRAYQLTIALIVASSLLNILKGLDFEEATINLALAGLLILGRQAFDIPSRTPVPYQVIQQTGRFIVLYYAYALAGFLILRSVIAPSPTVPGVALEPFRLVLGQSTYTYLTPQAQWFGRSLVIMGSAAVLGAIFGLLRPFIPVRRANGRDLDRVRVLVKQHGSDSLSYFTLQAGRSYFFHHTGGAVLSYRMWGNVALVGGDPLGPSHLLPGLLHDFLEFARDSGMNVCLLGISAPVAALCSRLGLRTVKIGEEALIDLPTFDPRALKRKVRRAARHVAELGFEARIYRRSEIPGEVLEQLDEISAEWVALKGGAERGFSMTLGRLPSESDPDCEIAVALHRDRVCGYLALVPVYAAQGWSLDSMRRRLDSPNGLMEFLIIHAAEEYRNREYRSLSLNFATLSNSEHDIGSRALEGTRRFLFEQLSGFYQLKSLYQFNAKFMPRWRSRYLAYGDMLTFPKVALAVVQSEEPLRLPTLAGVFRR